VTLFTPAQRLFFLHSIIKFLFKEKFINLDDMKPFILQRKTAAIAAG
jgi:hypothetical protein